MPYSRDLRRFIKKVQPLVHVVSIIVKAKAEMKVHDRDAALSLLAIIEGKFDDLNFDIWDFDRHRKAKRQERADRREAEREAARSRTQRGLPAAKVEYAAYVAERQRTLQLALARWPVDREKHPAQGAFQFGGRPIT